jgi:hypothetical protein
MKYDDEELAAAALLLAHVEPHPMPRDLRRKLEVQGIAMASEVRFTTTKAAAVVGPAPERVGPHGSSLRTWGGWLAAAACFAALVYQWRVHAIEQGARVIAAASAPAAAGAGEPFDVRGADGSTLAVVSWDPVTREGRISSRALAANARGEHYVLWMSPGDASRAVPVGAFACTDGTDGTHTCAEKAFGPTTLSSVASVWLTRGPIAEAPGALADAAAVGEGRRAAR